MPKEILMWFVYLQLAVTDALDLMLTGKTVNAKKAKRLGLVDSVVEPIGKHLFLINSKYQVIAN